MTQRSAAELGVPVQGQVMFFLRLRLDRWRQFCAAQQLLGSRGVRKPGAVCVSCTIIAAETESSARRLLPSAKRLRRVAAMEACSCTSLCGHPIFFEPRKPRLFEPRKTGGQKAAGVPEVLRFRTGTVDRS